MLKSLQGDALPLSDEIINSLPGIFYMLNLHGQFIRVNNKFVEVSGYSSDELECMTALDLFEGDDKRLIAFRMKEVFESGDSFAEAEIVTKSGTKIHYYFTGHRISSHNQNYLIGLGTDISERTRVEAALSKSEGSLRTLIHTIPDLIWLKNAEGVYLSCNHRFEKFFGASENDIAGHTDYDFVGKELADFFRVNDRLAMMKGGPSVNEEWITFADDGHRELLETTKTPIYDANGHLIGVLGIGHDITARIEAEKALKAREERFQALFDRASEGILIISPGGKLISANESYARVLGYTPCEMKTMDLKDIDTPEGIRKIPERMRRLLAGEHLTFEVENYHKDGHIILLEVSASLIVVEGVLMVQSFARDITERKQIEAELSIAATAFESHESLMITDANGVILRVNHAFTETTGYEAKEVIGKTPRVLKSGRHHDDFYRAMWEAINNFGTWQGEIWDRRKNGDIYPKWLNITAVKSSSGIVTHYVGSHIDISERKAAEEKIQHLAFYDPLTNLPNRRLLLDRLDQALASSARSGRQGALLFIDLDNFKALNDTIGHNIGDMLLQQVSQRLSLCVRECDTVARLGGDEFVVVLEELGKNSLEAAIQVETICEKLLSSISKPYLLATHECRSTASIGATLFGFPQQEKEDLLKQADIAMYQAKKAGRSNLRFYDPKMQGSINARVELERELNTALEHKQFELYYQIQVDSSSQPVGAEALIRWLHPEKELVLPAEFIQQAEETGLIIPIGKWVLEEACAQLKAWETDGFTRDLCLSVNVSARQFHQPDFVSHLINTIRNHAINPKLLKLELTESILLDNIDNIITTMNQLKELGVRFSLDDFGTGYSSLQYLKRLPIAQLKIDRSFIQDIATDNSDKAIVNTIIAMAHSMNLDVIAEGVETEEQRQILLSKGCSHFQGYLFGRPVSLAQFHAKVKAIIPLRV